MPRKHFYLSQEVLDALDKLAEATHLNTSQFLSKTILEYGGGIGGHRDVQERRRRGAPHVSGRT